MSEVLKHESAHTESHLSDDISITYALLHTAQQTLTDLDKSVNELAKLVEGLKSQSAKIAEKPLQRI